MVGFGNSGSAISSEETRSTNSSDKGQDKLERNTVFEMLQYARSVITPRSRTGPISLKNTKSVFKNVVQTEKQEWKNQPSGAPGLVRQNRRVSRERERTGSTKSLQSRQTEAGTSSGPDAEAERIWQNTTEEDEDNRSVCCNKSSMARKDRNRK